MPLAKDLLHPSADEERRKHKKKRLVQSPNSYFMDVKCPGVVCSGCNKKLGGTKFVASKSSQSQNGEYVYSRIICLTKQKVVTKSQPCLVTRKLWYCVSDVQLFYANQLEEGQGLQKDALSGESSINFTQCGFQPLLYAAVL